MTPAISNVKREHGQRRGGTRGSLLGSICVGAGAGAGGCLAPGAAAYCWSKSQNLPADMIATAPLVFTVALIVMACNLGWVRRPAALACFSAIVAGLLYALCEAGMQFGAVLFRWSVMGPAGAEIDGGVSRNISLASILGAQLSGSGIAFLILAAVVGVAVGTIWSRLVFDQESRSD